MLPPKIDREFPMHVVKEKRLRLLSFEVAAAWQAETTSPAPCSSAFEQRRGQFQNKMPGAKEGDQANAFANRR
jgi:hypothetical protein